MQKIYSVLFFGFILTFSFSSFAQKNLFLQINETSVKLQGGKRSIIPQKYRTLSMDKEGIKSFLRSLPQEEDIYNRKAAPVLELPMPDGNIAKFNVWESSVQEPALQAKFPEIRTYAGQGIDDPYATIRFDYNPYSGFHAQILSAVSGRIYIDPYSKGNTENYISYYHANNSRNPGFQCNTEDIPSQSSNFGASVLAGPCRGTQLTTYRFAFSCTGEYAQTVGGGLAGPTHAAIVTSTNRISQVYEVELAIRFILIGNNDLVEFLDPATDPYQNDGSSDLNIITSVINNAVGSSSYDVGHLACTDDNAGVAGLGVVCGGSKGRGLTGGLNPVGDGYDIDFLAHEMGHQFGAGHTFNSNNCASSGGSYEPGGGTTIMAYAGICSPNENIQPNSDPIFHAKSFDDISNFLSTGNGGNCPVTTPTGNTGPYITMGASNLSIPVNTPFTLTATATDVNGDALTYNWEGWDIGPAGSWLSAATSTTRPLFRTRVPKTTGSRTFPDIRVIAANYPGTSAPSVMDGLRGEVLPQVARTMKFRLTVRDNRAGGGGVSSAGEGCQHVNPFIVNAVGSAPFAVTVPNGGQSYAGGSNQTITWNVVGTDATPFNVANVMISLSTDGGLTYPTVISASTPNDGSEILAIPNIPTITARVKVEALGNIFFDISNANFTITVPINSFTFNATTATSTPCPATNPTVTIGTTVTGTFTTPIVLTATGAPAGTTVTFSPNPLTPGNSTVATLNNANTLPPGTYNITVTGTAGSVVQTTTITFIISAGTAPVITTQPVPQSVCAPGAATFTVASLTVGTVYQWQVSTAAVPPFTNIPGATSASYTIPATTVSMNGNVYRVIVSTQCGSTTSASATLTVNTAAAITAQPANQFACTGNTATFTVGATGTGVTYQWQSSATAGGPFTNVTTGTGGNTATYTTSPITGTTDGFYRVIITTSTCPGTVTSNVASLTITTTAIINTQPVSQSVCAPATATFSMGASGSGLSYQWQVSTPAIPAFTNIPGAQASSYNIGATTSGMNGYIYRVIVSNSCNSVTSGNATLTVNTAAAITAQPSNQSACTGNTATFTVGASGTGVTYQWQSATSAGGPFTNVSTGTGGTTATYTTAAITVTTPGFSRVIVSTTTCPGSVTSNTVTLTISETTAISVHPASQTVCAPAPATFSVTATAASLTYQWQVSTPAIPAFTNIAGAQASSYNTGATTVSMNGNIYRVIVTGTCNTITSSSATLTVNTSAAITAQPAPQTVCNGTTATFTVAASGTAATYQWQQGPTTTGPFTNVSAGTGGTTATYTTPVTTPAMNNTYYRVIVTTTACPGSVTSNAVLLTVNTVATITSQPVSQSACVPATVTFSVSASGTGLSYVWQESTNGGVSFNDIPTATAASYTTPPTSFSMNGRQYRVLVYSTCSPALPITSAVATLTVNNLVIVSQNPLPQRGCAGDNYTFNVAATGGTLTYQWQVSTNGGITYTNVVPLGSGRAAAYTITNAPISLNGNLYRVVVTGTPCGQVTTPGALLTLGNKPSVTLYVAGPTSLNPSINSTLTATVTPAGNYIYELRKNGVIIPNTLATAFMPLNIDGFGTYQLTVTNAATGCAALSNIVRIDSLASNDLFIYPNPVSTIMQVRYYNASTAPRAAMLNVYDSKGARVYSKAYTTTGTYGRMDVDMTYMQQGIYTVTLMDASGNILASGRVLKGH